ncbi:hypothetical protein ACFSKW_49850 [Nonomuraea mangrovi]|uniref:Uncharacterized protein n=1 Tax=Nonomuraea mangrovi TaxID=2316207 RepID=A0ABW4TC40_9ACTN
MTITQYIRRPSRHIFKLEQPQAQTIRERDELVYRLTALQPCGCRPARP